jgi:hypothetical protein
MTQVATSCKHICKWLKWSCWRRYMTTFDYQASKCSNDWPTRWPQSSMKHLSMAVSRLFTDPLSQLAMCNNPHVGLNYNCKWCFFCLWITLVNGSRTNMKLFFLHFLQLLVPMYSKKTSPYQTGTFYTFDADMATAPTPKLRSLGSSSH